MHRSTHTERKICRISIRKFLVCICFLLLGINSSVSAQSAKDSASKQVLKLGDLYQEHILSEKSYLDSTAVTMRLIVSQGFGYTNKELLQLMSFYRNVIWTNPKNEKYKPDYYLILSNNAKFNNRNGEMLYYGEKMREAEQKSGGGPSITSLMLMADYYLHKGAHELSLKLYKQNRVFIQDIPVNASATHMDIRQLGRAVNLLSYLGQSAYHELDTVSGEEISKTMSKIRALVETNYKDNQDVLARLKDAELMILYSEGKALKNPGLIWKAIKERELFMLDKSAPEYFKGYLKFSVTDEKVLYYLEHGPNDSAMRYLRIMEQLDQAKSSPYNQYMIKKYDARLLYNQGRYKESVDTLRRAIEFMDTAMEGTVTEISDMMYSLAKVDEQQILMAEAEARQKKTDRQILILISSFLVLFFGSIFTIRYIRKRQKARFLEFKLNLARNLHDEANPALLYAKTLAKADRTTNGTDHKTEIEQQIERTMELIRSLAHDLKSEKQFSIADLIGSIKELLQKIAPASGFRFHITEDADQKRFLSHHQFTQLKAILQECISNTIKHATFDNLDLRFSSLKDQFSIRYSDNGPGWNQEETASGIGLENITERIQKLNADMDVQNNYPNGYYYDFRLKLH